MQNYRHDGAVIATGAHSTLKSPAGPTFRTVAVVAIVAHSTLKSHAGPTFRTVAVIAIGPHPEEDLLQHNGEAEDVSMLRALAESGVQSKQLGGSP